MTQPLCGIAPGRVPIAKLTMSVADPEPAAACSGSERAVHQSTTSLIWITGVAFV